MLNKIIFCVKSRVSQICGFVSLYLHHEGLRGEDAQTQLRFKQLTCVQNCSLSKITRAKEKETEFIISVVSLDCVVLILIP